MTPPLTPDHLAELRRLAGEATAGPWHHRDRGVGWSVHTSGGAEYCTWADTDLMDYDLIGKGVFSESQAAYIAAVSPDVVLALIEAAQREAVLRAAAEALRAARKRSADVHDEGDYSGAWGVLYRAVGVYLTAADPAPAGDCACGVTIRGGVGVWVPNPACPVHRDIIDQPAAPAGAGDVDAAWKQSDAESESNQLSDILWEALWTDIPDPNQREHAKRHRPLIEAALRATPTSSPGLPAAVSRDTPTPPEAAAAKTGLGEAAGPTQFRDGGGSAQSEATGATVNDPPPDRAAPATVPHSGEAAGLDVERLVDAMNRLADSERLVIATHRMLGTERFRQEAGPYEKLAAMLAVEYAAVRLHPRPTDSEPPE